MFIFAEMMNRKLLKKKKEKRIYALLLSQAKAFLYNLVFFLGWFFGFGGGFFCKNFFVHSLSCFAGLVGVCCNFSLCFWLGFFLYTVGNRVSVSPFLLIISALFLLIKIN